MKSSPLLLSVALASFCQVAASPAETKAELQERRQRAAKEFSDGVLLLHSGIVTDFAADGYREGAGFFYLTGLEDSPGVILAIDGKTAGSWLFIPPAATPGAPEALSGAAEALKLGLVHVLNWNELESFLARQAQVGAKIYYERGTAELPDNLAATKEIRAPAWIQLLQKRWPAMEFKPANLKLFSLMDVESPDEQVASRAAARATVQAFLSGMRAIRSGVSQRSVEVSVETACWTAGAHGVSFWPWIMAGPNGVFPKPFDSYSRYDHLDATMHAGDLVRLDVGCEWRHYQGDLGRTIPVSGRYTADQREIWNAFVAAYRAGGQQLREGMIEAQIFEAWRKELLRHRSIVGSPLARRAIDSWSDRKNVPYWQVHTCTP
jgi:Xaa-Pro aminopeptidase